MHLLVIFEHLGREKGLEELLLLAGLVLSHIRREFVKDLGKVQRYSTFVSHKVVTPA